MRALAAVAAAQHGAISVSQVRAAGMSARAQRTAVERGWLLPVAEGVLVIGGSGDTWHRRLQIGLLALGTDGWVSHEAAATLFGLDRCLDDPVHLTVPRSARWQSVPDGMVVHSTAMLGPSDLVVRLGFRCTSATRTILDLATIGVPPVRLAASIDSAVRSSLTAPVVLAERLATLRGSGRAGVRTIDRLLPDSGVESMLERRFLRLLRSAGLPLPSLQEVIRNGRRHIARVDFSYGAQRLVVELTGRLGHVSDAERTRDAQRRNELQDLGYTVIEYTSADVRDRPEYVVDSMRRRLSASSASAKAAGSGRFGMT